MPDLDTAELRLTIAHPCWKNAVWPREKALALLDEVERLRGEGDRLEEQLHATVDDLGDVITTLRARVATLADALQRLQDGRVLDCTYRVPCHSIDCEQPCLRCQAARALREGES